MAVVVDASAAANIGQLTDEGQRLMMELAARGEDTVAPDFMMVESANIAWKYVHTGRMSHAEAWELYRSMIEIPSRYYSANQLAHEAFNEASRKDHPVYDMAYFVLARRLGASMATCDKRLRALCESEGIHCI